MRVRDYNLKGQYGYYAKVLKGEEGFVSSREVLTPWFKTTIDLVLFGALVGFLVCREYSVDSEKLKPYTYNGNQVIDYERIYADAFSSHLGILKRNYQLIMLMDDTLELDTNKRIKRAFMPSKEEEDRDWERFMGYAMNGIEYLYKRFSGTFSDNAEINIGGYKRIFDKLGSINSEIQAELQSRYKEVNKDLFLEVKKMKSKYIKNHTDTNVEESSLI